MMKYAFAALVVFSSMAHAGSIPEGCTPVIANWTTAPTYSCPIVDTNNTPFCDKPGISWQQKKEHGCVKCGNHDKNV